MRESKNLHDEGSLPSSPPRSLASWYAQGLSDGLGDRLLMFDNSTAPSFQLLRFRPDFAQIPGFETALREQVRRLSQFRHPAFAPVRSVQRLEPDDNLVLISDCTPGKRLSEVLHHARGAAFAETLIRQLAPAMELLQRYGPGISHGVLNPDRIVVSPDGRLTIVEHVIGPALESLNLRAAHLASIGIAVPPTADGATPRLDVATDWYQLGLVAVSVLIGRPVTASELPQLEALLNESVHPRGSDGTGLSPFMRQWLHRALQISGPPIESGADAHAALEELLDKERTAGSRRLGFVARGQQESSVAPPIPCEARLMPEPIVSPAAPVRPPIGGSPTTEHREPLEGEQPPAEVMVRVEPDPAAASSPDRGSARAAAPESRPAPARVPVQDRPPAAHAPSYTPPATTQAPPHVPRVAAHVRDHQVPAATTARLPDAQVTARVRPDDVGRPGFSTAIVAALALIVVAEAGVIAGLARALWNAPHPPLVIEASASGEDVLVRSRSTDTALLRLSVAPDLRWLRVTSPSTGMPAAKAAGTVQISSPIALKVLEDSRVLASVPGAGVVKVPAGPHQIELVNEELGYHSRHALEVEAGGTVSIHVAPAPGLVTIDASPWADVAINGQAIGRTPLGPLPLVPGEHQVTFRHPAGTKDGQRVIVKSGASTRVVGILR